MSDIKIFMCCHKPFAYSPPMCIPIQCGSALHEKMNGVLHDDDGENISAKNPEYCELTAHYYTWKNVQADYYGFCHYRRFFCFGKDSAKPYLAKRTLSDEDAAKLGTEEQIRSLVESCDIIAPRSENMGAAVRRYYENSRYQYAEDLNLFIEILTDKFPQLKAFADEYLSQTRQYFCNMFVMKRDIFFDYCEKLFDVLFAFDERKTPHGDFQSDRTDGFLGELFTGMYINSLSQNGADIIEVARMDVGCDFVKRAGYYLLPPESKRRFFVKKLLRR